MPRRLSGTFLSILTSSLLHAQFDTGQIAGYIRDASQAVITGATVTVTNLGNGEQRTITTNANGYYVIPNLQVGTYSVSAEMPGLCRPKAPRLAALSIPDRSRTSP